MLPLLTWLKKLQDLNQDECREELRNKRLKRLEELQAKADAKAKAYREAKGKAVIGAEVKAEAKEDADKISNAKRKLLILSRFLVLRGRCLRYLYYIRLILSRFLVLRGRCLRYLYYIRLILSRFLVLRGRCLRYLYYISGTYRLRLSMESIPGYERVGSSLSYQQRS